MTQLLLSLKTQHYANMLITGQQEYSSRQAGITFGIVLAVIIPLVLLLVYAGYKILQKRKAEQEEDDNADLVYQENLRYSYQVSVSTESIFITDVL